MQDLRRFFVVSAAFATATACSASASSGSRPHATIELLARSITYDSARAEAGRTNEPIDVTLTLVGERLLDYGHQSVASSGVPGAVPAIASFDPPNRRRCCWQPAVLDVPARDVSVMQAIHVPASVEEEAPADLDVDGGTPALQAVSVSFPMLEHVKLAPSEIAILERSGVNPGSPAVATIDVSDMSAPFVTGLHAPDARELASDPSNPPTTADLPATVARPSAKCRRGTTSTPERYARTLTALGPVFFHRSIATPHTLPRGDVSMSWSVLGPDHVRALFASASRGCRQDVLIDIMPAAKFVAGVKLHAEPSDRGTLYRANDGRRTVLVYDKIVYDVKSGSPYATRVVTRGLVVDSASAVRARTE